MAIDTVVKRQNAGRVRRPPWFWRLIPLPDGTIDAGDRRQVGYAYRDLVSAVVPPITDFTLDFDYARNFTLDFDHVRQFTEVREVVIDFNYVREFTVGV